MMAALAAAGCESLDPFTDEQVIEARASRYPTLRPPVASPQPISETPEAAFETASLTEVKPRIESQIFRGRTPGAGAQGSGLSGDTLVLNFENASIAEAASLILGDFLGAPYDIHPTVNGVINLKSADALPGDAALGAFETVLRQNNAALVEDRGVYRIVPASLALGYAAAPQIGAGRPLRPGYAVQITPLKYVSATDMAAIIKPLAGEEAVIRIDTERNLLLLAGSSGELSLWLETIRTFDIDWFAGKSVGIFPLRQVGASQIVKELEAIFDVSGADEDATVKFLSIERTNAVMAITRAASLLDKVKAWTQRLDRDSGAARRLRVYSMKNAKASDVAPLLQEIFDAPSDNTNARSIVAPGETPSTNSPGVVAVSTAAPRRASQPRSGSTGGLRIIPDESANTLLMMATQEEYDRVVQALRQLDVAPLQVLVEATIVEVTITNDLRYGVQYFLDGSIAQESAVATLSSAASSAILPTFPGASLVLGEPTQIVLDALEDITDINVISSPNLMVLDNQTARLVVGDQIPVTVQNVTNGFTSGDTDPVLFNSIEFRDTGVIFEVTPRISSDGSVTLDLIQEISTVSPTAQASLTPTINQRRIESSVVAQSGQTIVLGGLFSDRESRGRSGIPVISRAPLFGGLFSSTNTANTRTELVVLIQPRILRNEADARAITREFQDRVTGLQVSADFERAAPAIPSRDPNISPAFPAPTAPAAVAPVQSTAAASPEAQRQTLPVLAQPSPQPSAPAVAASSSVNANDITLESVLPATPARAERSDYFIQLGAYETREEALNAVRRVQTTEKSLRGADLQTTASNGLYRLLAGPFDQPTASSVCAQLNRPCAVVGE